MLNEITKKEFEERYPEVSTYGLEAIQPSISGKRRGSD